MGQVLTAVLGVVGVLSSIAGIVGFVYLVSDRRYVRAVRKTREFPLRLNRAIKLRDYMKVLDHFVEWMKEQHRVPDVVIGIHYGGISSASDVARRMYKPLGIIVTEFSNDGVSPKVESVRASYPSSLIRNKKVLLVDNRIQSGGTLSAARSLVLGQGASSVQTLVVYRPNWSTAQPDLVIFEAKRDLKNVVR